MEVHSESIGVGGHAFRLNIVRISNEQYMLHVVHDNGTRGGEIVAEERLRPDPLRGLVLDNIDAVVGDIMAVAGAGKEKEEGQEEGNGNGNGKANAAMDPAQIRADVEDALVRAALRFNLLQDTALHNIVHLMRVHWVQASDPEVARLIMECARASGGDVSVAAGILRAANVAPEDVMEQGKGEVEEGREGQAPGEGSPAPAPTGMRPPHDPCRALYGTLAGAAGRAGAAVVMEEMARMGVIGRTLGGREGLPPMTVGQDGPVLVVDPFSHSVALYRPYTLRDGRISYRVLAYGDILRARFLAIRRIVVVEGWKEYEVEVEKPDGSIVTYRGTVQDVVKGMAADAIVTAQRYALDAVSKIVTEAEERGFVERVVRRPPGVYIEGERLVVEWPRGAPPEGDLAAALDLLDELARWYPQDKFATVMKWGLASPLSYAVRKLGGVFPNLVPYGPRDTGKTTLGQIASGYMWERDPRAMMKEPEDLGAVALAGSGESLGTAPRVRDIGRATTFPVLVNEANRVFLRGRGDVANYTVLNVIKDAASAPGGYAKFPSSSGRLSGAEILATFVLTLNPTPPVDFDTEEWRGKTFLVVEFSRSDVFTKERIAEFSTTVEDRLPGLAPLGRFALQYVAGRGVPWLREVVKAHKEDSWDAIGREVLEAAYRAAGREPPAWVGMSAVEDIDKVRREELELLRETIVERLGAALWRAYMEVLRIPGAAPAEDWAERIRLIAKHQGVPWLRVVRSEEGEESVEEAVLLIGVLEALREREGTLPIASLKDLANLMGWKYGQVHSRATQIHAWGIRVRLSEMAALLGGAWEPAEGQGPSGATG
ncbi:MAG: hypothetical protein RAK18_05565, partial [Conexivisphaerales archaeon]|jgi:hypothetical protein|nr:hypothetical protein [Conexivisphaerales archaeon]